MVPLKIYRTFFLLYSSFFKQGCYTRIYAILLFFFAPLIINKDLLGLQLIKVLSIGNIYVTEYIHPYSCKCLTTMLIFVSYFTSASNWLISLHKKKTKKIDQWKVFAIAFTRWFCWRIRKNFWKKKEIKKTDAKQNNDGEERCEVRR